MFEQCVRGSGIGVASAQLYDREVHFLLGRVAHQLLRRRSGTNDEQDTKPLLVFDRNQRRESLLGFGGNGVVELGEAIGAHFRRPAG